MTGIIELGTKTRTPHFASAETICESMARGIGEAKSTPLHPAPKAGWSVLKARVCREAMGIGALRRL